MRTTIRTVTPANAIPLVIDLAAAKLHLNEDRNIFDTAITAHIRAAQDFVERFCSQVLTPRAMEMVLDGFPCSQRHIDIPRTPVTEITSLKYTDGVGAEIVVASEDYRWSDIEPALLLPAFGTSWPTAAAERGSVRLRFQAGYEQGLAPASLEAAVKLMVGHLFEHRGAIGAEVPEGVVSLCSQYRRT